MKSLFFIFRYRMIYFSCSTGFFKSPIITAATIVPAIIAIQNHTLFVTIGTVIKLPCGTGDSTPVKHAITDATIQPIILAGKTLFKSAIANGWTFNKDSYNVYYCFDI